jgi:hypothetical protein
MGMPINNSLKQPHCAEVRNDMKAATWILAAFLAGLVGLGAAGWNMSNRATSTATPQLSQGVSTTDRNP